VVGENIIPYSASERRSMLGKDGLYPLSLELSIAHMLSRMANSSFAGNWHSWGVYISLLINHRKHLTFSEIYI
jgi:hypothetical protein